LTPELVDDVRDYWSFTGILPQRIMAVSPFGHLIVRDHERRFWYLDPELRTLEMVADDEAALVHYMEQPDVREIWEAAALVEQASALLGPPPPGRCFSLKPMALLAGDYASKDFWHPTVSELIRFSGSVAEQTRDLPEGAKYQIKVVD